MSHELVDDILIVVHGPLAPAPAEWQAYVDRHERLDYRSILVVLDKDSPGPNARQRADATEALKRRGSYPSVAVITPSALHRGIVTVFGWFQKGKMVTYHPVRLREALDAVGAVPAGRSALVARLHQLAITVGSPWISQNVRLAEGSAA